MKKTKTVNGLRYIVQAKSNRMGTRYEVLLEHEEGGKGKIWIGDFRSSSEADRFLDSLPPEEFEEEEQSSSRKNDQS